jgi:hypothetical protein
MPTLHVPFLLYLLLVLCAGPGSRRIASTRPDGSGRYQFRTLPAGEYRIALTTDLVPEDLRDTAALERLFAQSVVVTIGVGEKKTLDLRPGR